MPAAVELSVDDTVAPPAPAVVEAALDVDAAADEEDPPPTPALEEAEALLVPLGVHVPAWHVPPVQKVPSVTGASGPLQAPFARLHVFALH